MRRNADDVLAQLQVALLKTDLSMVHYCPPMSVVMGNVFDIGGSG